MIKINLLPYHEKKKKENVARQISITIGSFVIFILLLFWLQIWISSSVSALESQVKQAETLLIDLNKKIGDLEKFKNIGMSIGNIKEDKDVIPIMQKIEN